ncbi:MAG: hypothetical protein K8U57_39055 [Planctomycetes bacterium]|nr:hypothetical protein [Planctomycetota bacterium]
MARPRVILFDVNETLLDLTPVKASVGKALGRRPELAPLWFTTLLQYSLVATVADHYLDFGEIGAACLRMVAGTTASSCPRTTPEEPWPRCGRCHRTPT